MRIQYRAVLVLASLACGAKGDYTLEWFKRYGCIDSVTVTPTHLSIRFNAAYLWLVRDKDGRNWRAPNTDYYVRNNEPLVLMPEEGEASLSTRHSYVLFTPVAYTGKRKGFRIMEVADHTSFGKTVFTNHVEFVVLGDAPVQAGEDDVEMIKESKRSVSGRATGEMVWIKYEKVTDAPPPEPEAPRPATQGEAPEPGPTAKAAPPNPAPDGTPGDGEAAAAPPRNPIPWLCLGILLCLCAVLWAARKSQGSKH